MAKMDMARKEGVGCCAPFVGELGTCLTQCGLGQGLLAYQVASSSIQPFGHNRHGPKIGGFGPLLGRGAGSSSNTKSPGPRPTSVLSGILIHPAIWPQQIWTENWGALPLCGRGSWVPMQNNVTRAEAYLHAKFHLDRSNRFRPAS